MKLTEETYLEIVRLLNLEWQRIIHDGDLSEDEKEEQMKQNSNALEEINTIGTY